MSAKTIFLFVEVGDIGLPIVIAMALMFAPWPRAAFIRAFLAILCGWAVAILYTIVVYNPAGIAAEGTAGDVLRFDNNAVASSLLGGWLTPAIAVCVFFVIRRLRREVVGEPGKDRRKD